MLNMHHKTSQIYELHINNNGTKIRFLTLYVFSLRYGFVIIYQKVFPLAVFSLNKSNFLSCTEYHMCVLTFKTIESHIWAEMKTFSCNIEYVIFPKLLLVLFFFTLELIFIPKVVSWYRFMIDSNISMIFFIIKQI